MWPLVRKWEQVMGAVAQQYGFPKDLKRTKKRTKPNCDTGDNTGCQKVSICLRKQNQNKYEVSLTIQL